MTHPTETRGGRLSSSSFSTPAKRLLRALGVAVFLLPTLAFAQYSSPVRDVENPAHSPLRLVFTITVPDGATSASNPFAATIPMGKRMVVEYVSITCAIAAVFNVDVATLDITTFDPNSGANDAMPVTKSVANAGGVNRYFASQRVRLYADGVPGPNMGGAVALTGGAPGPVVCSYVVSGYTVNTP